MLNLFVKKNMTVKTISLILVLTFLVSIFPSSAFNKSSPVIKAGAAEVENIIIGELTDKRDQYTKTFLRDDNTQVAIVSAQPLHYKENGKWVDIDNTLVSATDKDGNEILTNSKNSFKVELPTQLKNGKNITVKYNNYSISFNLSNNDKELTAKVKEKEDAAKNKTGAIENVNINNLITNVEYNAEQSNTNIKYSVKPEGLKEEIVVNSTPSKALTYVYDIKADGLTAKLLEDNSIKFFANGNLEGEPVFVMPAPFMSDADNKTSNDIKVTLDTEKDDKCTLTYAPSFEWMKDIARKLPIVIDPTVQTTQSTSAIDDLSYFKNTTPSFNKAEQLYCGGGSSYGNARSFIKFNNLPSLYTGNKIISAKLNIYHQYESGGGDPQTYPTLDIFNEMDVHKVTSAWAETDTSWTDFPTNDTEILDYIKLPSMGNQSRSLTFNYFRTLDITKAVYDWYNGEDNYGIVIKRNNEELGPYGLLSYFWSSDGPYSSETPYLEIEFANNTGIESYWDYHTQDIGRAGKASINDATGNLVLIQDQIGYAGGKLPVDIKLVYNSDDADDASFGDGYGRRTNYNQMFIYYGDYSIYVDGDGTRHYLVYDEVNEKYIDPNGSQIYVVDQGGESSPENLQYRMVFPDGMEYFFSSYGMLRKIQDNNPTPNHIDITYLSNNCSWIIDSITDGSGRVYDFVNIVGILDHIDYLGYGTTALETVSYTYTEDHDMESITFPDNEVINLSYDDNHYLYEAENVDGLKYRYTFSDTNPMLGTAKVTNVEKFGTDGTTAGDTLDITYDLNQTTFEDYRGRKEIKQFNKAGNTISVRDENGNALFGKYALPGDDNYRKNQLLGLSTMQNTSINYFDYYSFENSENNDYSTIANNGASATVNYCNSSQQYMGDHAMSINMASDTGNYGVYQSFTGTPGKTYTFTAWVKTTGFSGTVDEGAWLKAECEHESTTDTAISTIIKTNGDWQQLEVKLTVTPGYQTNTLKFYMFSGNTGTVYFDCVQAGEAKTGYSGNYIENADFANPYTTSSSSIPEAAYCWSTSNLNSSDVRTSSEASDRGVLDDYSFKITGQYDTAKRICQDVDLAGSAGDTYNVSAWAKASAVKQVISDPPVSTDRDFSLMVTIHYTSQTYVTYRFPYNSDVQEWQYLADTFTTEYDYTSIEVSLVYSNQVNTAYFDGVELCKGNFGTKYEYDANGNRITSTDRSGATTTVDYDENNNPDTITDPSGHVSDYTFDEYFKLTNVVSAEGVENIFGYDDFGNNLTQTITDGIKNIITTTIMDDDDNYVDTVTDALGNVTDYDYNVNYGTLDSVTAPDNTTTNYGYNSSHALTSATKDVTGLYGASSAVAVTNNYTFTDDKLTKITHNDMGYHYSYDIMGNLTRIKVGSTSTGYDDLIINTYDTAGRSYNLTNKAFDNGQSISYTYDGHNNLNTIRYNGDVSDRFVYTYDNVYSLVSKKDNTNNIFTMYNTGLNGLLSLTQETGINGRTYSHSFGNQYNAYGVLTAFIENVNGVDLRTDFAYNDDNQLLSTTLPIIPAPDQTYTKANRYDSLGRLSGTDFIQTDDQHISHNYGKTTYYYKDTTDTKSTQQIYLMNITGGTGANSYEWMLNYNYDVNGNITSQSKNGTVKNTYYYDELNQLVRVDDVTANKTTTYKYDVGGNIREKKEYAYTTGTLGSPTDTIPYSYTHSYWKDLLTSYDGNSISYDEIGNPTAFNGWSYTWAAGRQLATMSKTGSSLSFKYNDAGIRTQKTVGSTVTDYTLVNDRVTAETDGTNTTYYRYDANNELISINYNGTEYFYIRNLQGDIVALADDSGALVAQYAYDAWGKLISVTGKDGNGDWVDKSADASFIGNINPYRYRGYRYDVETGLYYLNSRYYNPEIGRFINADDPEVLQLAAQSGQILGANLFAYCGNNPVMGYDPSGYFYISAGTIKSIVRAIFAGCRSIGWGAIGRAIAPLFVVAISWINALPVAGQIIFCYIAANVLYAAGVFALAYVSYKGVEIRPTWWLIPKFYVY